MNGGYFNFRFIKKAAVVGKDWSQDGKFSSIRDITCLAKSLKSFISYEIKNKNITLPTIGSI
jgi:hypothetical protein